MIEIKTQENFNNINNIIKNISLTGEMIRIYSLDGDRPYILSTPILINKSNIIIEGFGSSKPKIQVNINEKDKNAISLTGVSGDELESIIIRNLNIVMPNNSSSIPIKCSLVGKSFSTGLTTGNYSRYDSTSVNASIRCRKGVTIENCKIHGGSEYGINISNSSNCTIIDTNIKNCTKRGVYIEDSKNITLSSNDISDNKCGIYLSKSEGCILTSNFIQNNRSTTGYGMALYQSCKNVITTNTVQNNEMSGIYLMDNSSSNTINNNNIRKNEGCGIFLNEQCITNTLTSNMVEYNKDGIYLNSSHSNTIGSNLCNTNKGSGILLIKSNNIVINANILNFNATGIKTQDISRLMVYGNNASANSTTDYSLAGDNIKNETKYNK